MESMLDYMRRTERQADRSRRNQLIALAVTVFFVNFFGTMIATSAALYAVKQSKEAQKEAKAVNPTGVSK